MELIVEAIDGLSYMVVIMALVIAFSAALIAFAIISHK